MIWQSLKRHLHIPSFIQTTVQNKKKYLTDNANNLQRKQQVFTFDTLERKCLAFLLDKGLTFTTIKTVNTFYVHSLID